MAVGDTFFESDGLAVNVTLSATVKAAQLAVVQGWVGITGESGDSGETIALVCDDREYQFYVPVGLAVAKGDIVYVTLATVTGHTPQDAAYTTASGAGKVALFKATAAKDANNLVTGIMMAHNALAS
jgi:Uncharacterized conserved protein (DUF2190)